MTEDGSRQHSSLLQQHLRHVQRLALASTGRASKDLMYSRFGLQTGGKTTSAPCRFRAAGLFDRRSERGTWQAGLHLDSQDRGTTGPDKLPRTRLAGGTRPAMPDRWSCAWRQPVATLKLGLGCEHSILANGLRMIRRSSRAMDFCRGDASVQRPVAHGQRSRRYRQLSLKQ